MQAIGIVDSGLGGYTIYEALTRAYPTKKFIFLADQKNAPYGSKTTAELLDLMRSNTEWFIDQGIREILIACNTASAVALDVLCEEYPTIDFYGIIDLTVDALTIKPDARVLVLATQANIQTFIYPRTLHKRFPSAVVTSKAMPQLVPLLEELADRLTIVDYLHEQLDFYKDKLDLVLLGCTHYPIVKDEISAITGAPCADSIDAIIAFFSDRSLPEGKSRCFTTKDAVQTEKQILTLFDRNESFSQADQANKDGK